MRVLIVSILLITSILQQSSAQISAKKFGDGIKVTAEDSSFYMRIGFRFQTLYQSSWNLPGDDILEANDHFSSLMIRRSRLKFDGWALSPKLKYKCELALSNRDNGGGNSDLYSNAANIILDAHITYNFYKGLSLRVGQGKMPGNRERLISSGNMQFVDRSLLNSRFTLDRDVGFMLLNSHNLSKHFLLKETFSFSSGEGKNITTGNLGGYNYTFKIEAFPFGEFQSKGAYVGSSVKRESKPKLAFAVAYDINQKAARTRGQKGSFLIEDDISYGKDLHTLFVDLMFKYNNWSLMAEYVDRATDDDIPTVLNSSNELLDTYFTGSAMNLSMGYITKRDLEFALRWTNVSPDLQVGSKEEQYTAGISKYIRGHKLKVQYDLTYRSIEEADDALMYRMQMDIHF